MGKRMRIIRKKRVTNARRSKRGKWRGQQFAKREIEKAKAKAAKAA